VCEQRIVCVRIFFGMHFFQRNNPPTPPPLTTTTTTGAATIVGIQTTPTTKKRQLLFFHHQYFLHMLLAFGIGISVGMLVLEQALYAAKIPTPKTMHTLTPKLTHTQTSTHTCTRIHTQTHTHTTKLKLWHLKTTSERLFSLGWVVVFPTTAWRIS